MYFPFSTILFTYTDSHFDNPLWPSQYSFLPSLLPLWINILVLTISQLQNQLLSPIDLLCPIFTSVASWQENCIDWSLGCILVLWLYNPLTNTQNIGLWFSFWITVSFLLSVHQEVMLMASSNFAFVKLVNASENKSHVYIFCRLEYLW